MKKIVIGLIIISIFLLYGCNEIKSSPSIQSCIDELKAKNLKPDKNFISGEVLIGFKENVTEDEAINIINSYGLNFEAHFPDSFAYRAKVLKGSPNDYIDNLESNDIVLSADWRGQGMGYIIVYFNITVTPETARQLINSIDGLEIDLNTSPIKRSSWAEITVPSGSEFEWICRLQENSNIEYAQLNEIEYLA